MLLQQNKYTVLIRIFLQKKNDKTNVCRLFISFLNSGSLFLFLAKTLSSKETYSPDLFLNRCVSATLQETCEFKVIKNDQ